MAWDPDQRLDFAGLQLRIRSAHPGATLVPSRILRRAILHDRDFAGLVLHIPHRDCYAMSSSAALDVLDADELGLPIDQPVPESILLVAWQPNEIKGHSAESTLRLYWQRLFHAAVHDELDRRIAEGRLDAAGLRRRIQRMGLAAFEEARDVLRREDLLLPPRDDLTTYVELTATYLELMFFQPEVLRLYFPGVEDHQALSELLLQDVDADDLFHQTRPMGLADLSWAELRAEAVAAAEARSGEVATVAAPESKTSLRRRVAWSIRRILGRGNVVRDAIRKVRSRTEPGLPEPFEELDQLVARLQEALALTDDDARSWREALGPLVLKAADSWQGLPNNEARLLFDIQTVCVDHERPVYRISLWDWAFSLGRTPLARRLPHQREVLIVRHLRSASARVRSARIPEPDRHRLDELLHEQLARAERSLRDRLRSIFRQTLSDNGLVPLDLPERVAKDKIVEELLDQVVSLGFLNFSDLRDAISRNNLKLPDMDSPLGIVQDDRLLRVDHALGRELDGIYRKAEIYFRVLHRASALAFGNPIGRFVTKYLALPFGGSFLILAGLDHTILHLIAWATGNLPVKIDYPEDVIAASTVVGTASAALASPVPPWPGSLGTGVEVMAEETVAMAQESHFLHLANPYSVVAFGIFLLGVLHVPRFRRLVVRVLKWFSLALKRIFIDAPRWLLTNPLVRRIFRSRTFTILWRVVLKPLALTALIWPSLPEPAQGGLPLAALGITFAVACIVLNSRMGRDAQEIATDALARTWFFFTIDLVPGAIRFLIDLFAHAMEGFERILYTVDQWLRFRLDQGRIVLAIKAVFGMFWGVIQSLIRVIINLFVEPQLNPVKHFPVVSVSHKLILPLAWILAEPLRRLGWEREAAYSIALTVFAMIPGIFGFFAWELKENWRLYRANRSRTLRPVVIGDYGETMLRLLKPGFHSGTIPKAIAKLRTAETEARKSGERWARVLKRREALRHIVEEIRHFLDREFLHLLRECPALEFPRIAIDRVRLAGNRIRLDLICDGPNAEPASLFIEEHEGRLVVGFDRAGWIAALTDLQKDALALALLGLYKIAGADVVWEQIQRRLELDLDAVTVREGKLQAWPSDPNRPIIERALSDGGSPLLFSTVELAWTDWSAAWGDTEAARPRPIIPDQAQWLPVEVLTDSSFTASPTNGNENGATDGHRHHAGPPAPTARDL